jgi:hypothetical protein
MVLSILLFMFAIAQINNTGEDAINRFVMMDAR